MSCPTCGHENRPAAKFCEECAAPITRLCASCGSELRPTAKFCDECGAAAARPSSVAAGFKTASGAVEYAAAEPAGLKPAATKESHVPRAYTPKHLADKILQSKSALEGERKQVTVLFADVKGSMELAEQLDAEAFSQIMSRFFRLLSDGVDQPFLAHLAHHRRLRAAAHSQRDGQARRDPSGFRSIRHQ